MQLKKAAETIWNLLVDETGGFFDAIDVTAFKNPGGEIVAVVLNHGNETEKLRLCIETVTAPVELPGHSLSTFVTPF